MQLKDLASCTLVGPRLLNVFSLKRHLNILQTVAYAYWLPCREAGLESLLKIIGYPLEVVPFPLTKEVIKMVCLTIELLVVVLRDLLRVRSINTMRKKVLIVDDSPSVLAILDGILGDLV
jgi:hypothetical protein